MTAIDPIKIAQDCDKFLRRKGHGSTKQLAEAACLSTETIRSVRKGINVDLTTLKAVAKAMRSLGWYTDDEKALLRTQETPDPYAPSQSVTQLLANKFLTIAGDIGGDHLTAAEKRKALVNFHRDLNDLLPAYLREIEKGPVKSN